MLIEKKGGYTEAYTFQKVYDAIAKSMLESEKGFDKELCKLITEKIDILITHMHEDVSSISVEFFHDVITEELATHGRRDVLEKYINYYTHKDAKKKWEMNDFQLDIWTKKYQQNLETFDAWVTRIAGGDKIIEKLIREKKLLFGGRILTNRGIEKKVTYSSCYVLEAPADNIESIFETAGKLARTFSYGGGVGIDIGKLRPRGAEVNNSAKHTTGAVSFMDLYSMVTGLIGQSGRRGALMISLPSNHPDLEEFINIKTDLDRVTKANISIRIDNGFMISAEDDLDYTLEYFVEDTGEKIETVVSARRLLMLLAKNNWMMAEPGALFWDRIEQWNLLSEYEDFYFAGCNPCAR